jgi:ribosome-binding protein aMBF1 (putative translation factor)
MQFADTVRDQIQAKGWSVKRFADEIGRTPEHARKISTGLAFPSDDTATRIAQKLELDHAKLQTQLDADRWEKKHKRKPPESEHPDLGPLENVWAELDTDQRELMLCVATCLRRRKRKQA